MSNSSKRKDSLGDRMKAHYEDRYRYLLPRRTYTILRLDGKAFHTLTRGCSKPFDANFILAMKYGAMKVCQEAQGSCFAYVQSDEASVLLTDFATPQTDAWFDGNIQKMCSIAASRMTLEFSEVFGRQGLFDCRAFTIPDDVEVENYFIWRQKDWIRNSLQMLARSHFSANQLHGKKQPDMHEMLHSKGVNWADLEDHLKNGSLISYEEAEWRPSGAFIFTQERDRLIKLIPKRWEEKQELN